MQVDEPYCCGSETISDSNQVIGMPHVLWLIRHQSDDPVSKNDIQIYKMFRCLLSLTVSMLLDTNFQILT